LNAADFGVPQMRERVFIIGARDGSRFSFPEPTHGDSPNELFGSDLAPYSTTWDALADLPEDPDEPGLNVGGKWGALLPSIPEGQNYLWHTERGGGLPLFGWRRRYWNFLLKIAKNRPSWTIQAQPGTATGPFHWSGRRLSSKELCRLQTFPDGLQFKCSRNAIQRMLGNAVPSLMAETLALEIRRQLLNDLKRRRRPKLMPQRQGEPAAPHPVARVPAEYHSIVGEHEDHPGEGRGSRATKQGRANRHQASLF